jgi:hypothetical protein
VCKESFDKTTEFLLNPDVVQALGSFRLFSVHKKIAGVRKETGFQDVGEDDVEMLGPSLILTVAEPQIIKSKHTEKLEVMKM